MTPAARVAVAIALVDRIAGGDAAEKALTNWARGARYAGSKDRAAVRDLVFDVLRMWRSTAVHGGAETGRGRLLGLLRAQGVDPEEIFTGIAHAPPALDADERHAQPAPTGAAAWDMPDWLAEKLTDDLGPHAEATALALRHRAPVFVRVNTAKTTLEAARDRLAQDGIVAASHPLSPTALEVTQGARGLTRSAAFGAGWIELQDAASQAVIDAIPNCAPGRILDYCAGGGGKSLALAARWPEARIEAHDIAAARMADLPSRAARAGVRIAVTARPEGPYDLVLCDAPCSGSGAWRRAPEGKWRLTSDRLAELAGIQTGILEDCAPLVASGGLLVYVTCSVLAVENRDQLAGFLDRNPGWACLLERQFLPGDGGDGFFVACLKEESLLV